MTEPSPSPESPWPTAVTEIEPNHVRVRGYDIAELMGRVTFGAMVALFSFLVWQRFTIRKVEKAIFAVRRRLIFLGKS